MTVIAYTYPDGSVSYQLLTWTPDALAALEAAPDPNPWIAANATITQTIAAG